jgi:hypothetical protein
MRFFFKLFTGARGDSNGFSLIFSFVLLFFELSAKQNTKFLEDVLVDSILRLAKIDVIQKIFLIEKHANISKHIDPQLIKDTTKKYHIKVNNV